MSYKILIDPKTPAWLKVVEAVRARQNELATQCCQVISTDAERRDAAIRLDELVLLLEAPAEAVAEANSRFNAGTDAVARKGVY